MPRYAMPSRTSASRARRCPACKQRAVAQRVPVGVSIASLVIWRSGPAGGAGEEARRNRGSHEQHTDEQQPATQKHRGEESILALANPVAHDPNEPRERDPRERYEVERHGDQASAARVREPGAGFARIRRRPEAHEYQRRCQQEREQDAGDRRCPGRPQRAAFQHSSVSQTRVLT